MRRLISFFILILSVILPGVGEAVIFYSTGDTAYNTNAPTGSLAGSGWQFQGRFRNTTNDKYLGTPIAPHHFITARHISEYPSVGEKFYYEGQEYTTITEIPDASSDLTLWEIDGTFSSYAPLYSDGNETGKDFVVFGRGTQRGDPVVANSSTNGWRWGPTDFVMRWGENRVDDTTTVNGFAVLEADFDSNGGANECMLSGKDSGGGLFIEDGGVWKLAGINYAVNPSTFSFYSTGSNAFNAALFDYSFRPNDNEKLYYYNGNVTWPYLNDNGNDPCRFYASRISSRYTWITNNIPDFDQDVDGLPDWWEIQYVGNATSMDSAANPDNDDFTNYEEWVADTDPGSSNSFLSVLEYTNATSLVFSSSVDRQYQVQFRTDLVDTNEDWMTEADWFSGSNMQTEYPVSTGSGTRFYRVRAKVR